MSSRSTGPSVPVAYGLAFPGLEHGGDLLEVAGAPWPHVDATYERDHPQAPRLAVAGAAGDDRLERSSPTGRVILDRRARTARYFTPYSIDAGEFVHPYLTTAATAFGRWEGRQVFHAGAFVADGLAWAIVGDMEAGKSTLLAALSLAGHPVLADDLLAVGEGQAFAGPRCIDLREASVDPIGARSVVRPARRGQRWRLRLPPVAPAVPFGGWIFLSWGDGLELRPLPVSERVTRVAYERMWWDMETDPSEVLALAGRRSLVLARPRRWSALDEVVQHLVAGVGAIPDAVGS
ncbi:MAG TPA: hypothetical protein VGN78_09610 [Solirubrobacteraceae bacterium]|nr:hypothetical protein [Solirubrobacteraceae bacterium]